MSDKKEHEVPFLTLGSRLRRLREQVKESLDEVAGAVEIATRDLEDFETGLRRPSEDILDLLISHFSMKKPEADKLWILAGYEAPQETLDDLDSALPDQPTIVVVPMDNRISYTDLAHVVANKEGVVVNFLQSSGAGTDTKPMIISRLGMSKEAAESLLHQLQHGLKSIEPKALPAKATRQTKK
jgi:transcriptional regulator with XRE-family HTH domain